MKKIFIATFSLLIISAAGNGQVIIQPNLPVTGLVQKNQLWNVLVVNSSASNMQCVLQVILRDRITGMDILTASSGQFILGTGTKQLNANQLGPIQYNYLSAGFDNRIQGLLPAGNYIACYVITSISITGKVENTGEECVAFDAEPLSPPMLIFPIDSSILETTANIFSWTAPTPQGMFSNLRYDIMITAIQEGQKAEEALQVNIPFYNQGSIFTNSLNYSSTGFAFEKEKWYAWQVVARDDRNYAGKSDVWVFKLGEEAMKEISSGDLYLLLQEEKKGTYVIAKRTLRIKYFSYNGEMDGVFVFMDDRGNRIRNVRKKVVQGDNYFEFELNNSFREGRVYKLFLEDNLKQHSLTFSINIK